MNGRIMVISISKIRNRIAIKKKWIEKVVRAENLGSNPHSNGDIFSRLVNFFLLKIDEAIIIINDRDIEIIKHSAIIIYTKIRSFDWKSIIINILYKYLPHQ